MYNYEDYENYYEPSELEQLAEEFKNKCWELILPDIKKRIEFLEEENKNYKDRNAELRSQLRDIDKLKQNIEDQKQELINEGIANYQREALSGLKCNDNVWTIKSETTTEKCKYCNGTHKIKVDVAGITKDVDCPHCDYGGKVITDIIYTPVKRIISQINNSVWNNNKSFKRYLYLKEVKGCNDNGRDEFIYDNEYGSEGEASERNDYSGNLRRDFWFTEEDCLAECKKRKEEWIEK